jgi:LmbE family N-acetylglucosaminyl deacetylase
MFYSMESPATAKSVAVIVAHPDDETLWLGGTILSHPSWHWFILSLCRGSDQDRCPRFFQALKALGAEGKMNDLDDGPEQIPLAKSEIEAAILSSLPNLDFDLIISHNPAGEYTRHHRHEEIGEAVITLWHTGRIQADELWTFAYEDGDKRYFPQPIQKAHSYQVLSEDVWRRKYSIITEIYGFQKGGFEAETTPRAEAFWRFDNSTIAQQWLTKKVFQHESSIVV